MTEQWRQENVIRVMAWRAYDGIKPRTPPPGLTDAERELWLAEYDRLHGIRDEQRKERESAEQAWRGRARGLRILELQNRL